MKRITAIAAVMVLAMVGGLRAASFEAMVNAEPPVRALAESARSLVEKLETHVAEYLTQPSWAPLLARMGEAGAFLIFDEQRLDVQALSAALPYISPELAARVRTHLANELERRLAADEAMRPASDRGARREHFLAIDATAPALEAGEVARGTTFSPTAAFYALWLYGQRSGDWDRVRSQWQRSGPRALAGAAKMDLRRTADHLAGLIGAARLARRFDDPQRYQTIVAHGQTVADALVQQFNSDIDRQLAVGSGFMSQARINWMYRAAIQRTWIEPLPILTPEVAALLREGCARRIEKSFAIIDKWYPSWWMAWGERIGGSSGYDQEDETLLPAQSMAIYSFQALARRREAAKLAMWTDVPWCRADAYYVMKLVIAIEAQGQ